MTNLQAIGLTAAIGLGVTLITFFVFGLAVRYRSPNIAPRCTARNPDVIYNPRAKPKTNSSSFLCWRKKSHNTGDSNDDEEVMDLREHVQYRGGPMLGWIPWTLSLSYDTLIQGVPGTGTRKGGLEGALLKVNLDGIVLLRFHALALRVVTLVTILSIVLILPLNLTARCYNDATQDCDHNMTTYDRTTLQNIPTLVLEDSVIGGSKSVNVTYLSRLYVVVFMSWIVVCYTIHLLSKEWIDALALRRVYYLESSHFENRWQELQETAEYIPDSDSDSDSEMEKAGTLRKRRNINKSSNLKKKHLSKRNSKKGRKKIRAPWIPHPEQRETVPNIELYSLLVGNVPSKPSEVIEDDHNIEAALGDTDGSSVHWQLTVATTFFDQCVPNQPGFSSSVAAVTILPDAPKLALAWRKWYQHVGLLRKLRFIRLLINEMRHYEIYQSDDEMSDVETSDRGIITNQDEIEPNTVEIDKNLPWDIEMDQSFKGYNEIWKRMNYRYNVFGTDYEEDVVSLLVQAMNYGPEQTAVYSREYAQGAAACCPNGCAEERARSLRIDQLLDLEAEIKVHVEESFKELLQAQMSNVENDVVGENEDMQRATKLRCIPNSESIPIIEDLHAAKTLELDNKLTLEKEKTDTITSIEAVSLVGDVQAGRSKNDVESINHEKNVTDESQGSVQRLLKQRSIQSLNHYPYNDTPSLGTGFSQNSNSIRHLSLTNEGKVHVRLPPLYTVETSTSHETTDFSKAKTTNRRITQDLTDSRNVVPNPNDSYPLRHRNNTMNSFISSIDGRNKTDKWAQVKEIMKNKDRVVPTGVWEIPEVGNSFQGMSNTFVSIKEWATNKTKNVVDELASDATFAVVTFTSRQAAVAARQCLADGRGEGKWVPVRDIPVPPLADAAVCDFKTCRGCCRPVTLSVNPKQQMLRTFISWIILAGIYIFSTFVITWVASMTDSKLYELIPLLEKYGGGQVGSILSGFIPAFYFSLFFALCPVIFKCISNFGSNAVSVNEAEYTALQYYWWFMLLTVFCGTNIGSMIVTAFYQRRVPDNSFSTILFQIAGSLSTQVSATWLNWIIFRTFFTIPLQYMLQINSYLFELLGWRCCRRCVMGGGPGGPIPYRIYIDSGVVFLCAVALSPVAPLVAPATLSYFIYCTPLWRRNVIFMYRPKFDTGGLRWPFLADIYITSIIVSQILLTTLMTMKRALGPAILASLAIIPVLIHRRGIRKKYLQSYKDAGLLQTSQLDNWDSSAGTSEEGREQYRRFLVDAHKAAYVPICIAGGKSTSLTAEPAVVIPHENDIGSPEHMEELNIDHDVIKEEIDSVPQQRAPSPITVTTATPQYMERANQQFGATMRRVADESQTLRSRSYSNHTGKPSLYHQVEH